MPVLSNEINPVDASRALECDRLEGIHRYLPRPAWLERRFRTMRARATRTSSEANENARGLQPQRVARSSDHCPEGPTSKRTFGLTAGPDSRVSCGFDGCYLRRHLA